MRSLLPLLILGALPASISAQQATDATYDLTGLPIRDSVVDAIYSVEETQVMEHLDELVNGIGARLTSSTNLTEAVQWAAGRFEGWGLDNVRLEAWDEYSVGFDRVYSKGRMISPRKTKLVFTTGSWTAGTDGAVRGPAVLAPVDEAEMEALRGKLAGAWVICPTTRPRFDSDADNMGAALGRFLDGEKIAGTIAPGRGELVHTSGRSRIEWANLPTRVGIVLRRDQVGDIVNRVEAGEAVELEFDIAQEFVEGPIPVYNVLAEIPGTDLADELIIIGGHIDSWDGAGGAQDNGTGTSTTLEAARLLVSALQEQGLKPRRTIRFMLWSGEEQGLLGSRAYIEQHPEEMDRISAVIVHDGGTNACAGIAATPAMMPLFTEAFAPIVMHTADNEDEVLRFTVDPTEYLPVGIGSDHDSYVSRGVPGFFWNQRGRTNYGFIHHTQHDWINEVAVDYQHFTARVVAASAWRLANMEQAVPREALTDPNPRRGRRPPSGRTMGVFLQEGTTALGGVSEGGLAEKAGMKAGDRVLSIGGTAVKEQGDLRGALRASGDRKLIVWQRGDQKMAAWFDWNKKTTEAAEAPAVESPRR